MRERKVHLAVDIHKTVGFPRTATYVLCHTEHPAGVTRDRAKVTCNICNHHIREFGDKKMIYQRPVPKLAAVKIELRIDTTDAVKQLKEYAAFMEKCRNSWGVPKKQVTIVGNRVLVND